VIVLAQSARSMMSSVPSKPSASSKVIEPPARTFFVQPWRKAKFVITSGKLEPVIKISV
jgi:hypothetical protein